MIRKIALISLFLLVCAGCANNIAPNCAKRVPDTSYTYGEEFSYCGDLKRQYDGCSAPVVKSSWPF